MEAKTHCIWGRSRSKSLPALEERRETILDFVSYQSFATSGRKARNSCTGPTPDTRQSLVAMDRIRHIVRKLQWAQVPSFPRPTAVPIPPHLSHQPKLKWTQPEAEAAPLTSPAPHSWRATLPCTPEHTARHTPSHLLTATRHAVTLCVPLAHPRGTKGLWSSSHQDSLLACDFWQLGRSRSGQDCVERYSLWSQESVDLEAIVCQGQTKMAKNKLTATPCRHQCSPCPRSTLLVKGPPSPDGGALMHAPPKA